MKYKLFHLCDYVKEKTTVASLSKINYISTENMLPNRGGLASATTLPTTEYIQAYCANDILVSNIRPYFKKIWFAETKGGCSNDVLVFRAKKGVNAKYLYYVLSDDAFFNYSNATSKGTKMPRGDKNAIMQYDVVEHKREEQEKIAKILSVIDNKIANNNAINNNLQQQVFALYRHIFVDNLNENRQICRADQYFDISIGKTPPRKEPEWFSNSHDINIKWVSISDMGSCGLYISDSSEYISREAVSRFNVVMIPDNTVILSFKLTIGRVAITDGEMTTNEAIAHFKTTKKEINEYLYCYLKSYNYQTLGSTSSIATAVNSKIIKAMPFPVPTDSELADFHSFAAPCFEKIRCNQAENTRLSALRDTILPKLMSGKIDVSKVEI